MAVELGLGEQFPVTSENRTGMVLQAAAAVELEPAEYGPAGAEN